MTEISQKTINCAIVENEKMVKVWPITAYVCERAANYARIQAILVENCTGESLND